MSNITKEPRKFACNLCPAKLTRKHGLERHMDSQHTKMLYSCNKCFTTYKKAETLKKHVLKPCAPKIGNSTIISVTKVSDWLEDYRIHKMIDRATEILSDDPNNNIYQSKNINTRNSEGYGTC